ncbi:uncharacterized protein HRG_10733 [Hirsutella rhossiliensis]|uniref:Reverse transcriptase/retrotransposon-derived protein RNase H-like domain-containing protein n=1 Tax=Hirsutella rhossiliensis TaxID=111463 RepID=A0A9P8SCV3_9HYPO|nr:uncharacterized protein HRG_10733 [Hirsutella rhossiliensis]KAH0958038.1 hypothetical protein HRG_10733 [Hirsutella rhossiliensis]
MDPDSEYLTAFRTRFGTFRWKVLPFGLKVGPAWFQQFINAQLHDLLDRTLNRLLKKDVAFVMGPEQREAFDQLKRLAIEAPVLAFFRPELPTRLETDASRNATAGVLWQEQPDQTWKPVGFFSKTMTPAERAYPIQDRELLAVVQSLEHFYPELLGQKFDVITDHEALVHFSTKRLLSVRQIRWSDFLAQFDIQQGDQAAPTRLLLAKDEGGYPSLYSELPRLPPQQNPRDKTLDCSIHCPYRPLFGSTSNVTGRICRKTVTDMTMFGPSSAS